MQKKRQFWFWTLLAMIVGICIWSGIFFKASSILEATGGNVGLGVLIFVLGAISIIFGSLSLAELALYSQSDAGLIGYFEQYRGYPRARAIARFQSFVYLPSITAIVAWVAWIYTIELFALPISEERALLGQVGIAAIYIILFALINAFSTKMGAGLQTLTMLIKLLPLLLIAIIGIWKGTSTPNFAQTFSFFAQGNWSRLMAIVPMAYSYDGRIVATTLGSQVDNPKKNLRLALVVGPLVVLVVYVLYFLGIVQLLGVEQVLADGKNAVYSAGVAIFGAAGGKLILTGVLVSLLGVVNGLLLATIRMPQLLGRYKMLGRFSECLSWVSEDSGELEHQEVNSKSLILALSVIGVWLLIHYGVMYYDLFAGGDISEISIVFTYLTYTLLYIQLFRLPQITSRGMKYLVPILALCGSGIIFIGSLLINPLNVSLFLLVCSGVCALGYRGFGAKKSDDS